MNENRGALLVESPRPAGKIYTRYRIRSVDCDEAAGDCGWGPAT